MISIVNTECHVPKTFSDLAKIAAWGRLGQVDALADLAGEDALVTATERYATLRRFSPAFLDAFTFKASGT
ncbi:hypothetical protein, partial [Novosphingobium sp. LASN5T]|uniref:hypothetical protein n=1 Tax=Novosphingobium sp. LASN5T TaxID=2491021 RepID=UPI0016817355